MQRAAQKFRVFAQLFCVFNKKLLETEPIIIWFSYKKIRKIQDKLLFWKSLLLQQKWSIIEKTTPRC